MSCPRCLHGRTIAIPDSGSYHFRAPRNEEEQRFSEPCECTLDDEPRDGSPVADLGLVATLLIATRSLRARLIAKSEAA